MAVSTNLKSLAAGFDRSRLARLADILVVALVVSLPWSTSATSVLVVLWILALLPTLDGEAIRREVLSPAGGLPILLCLLAVVGVLWSEGDWHDRLHGIDSYLKFLAIPFLLAHLRRSNISQWVVWGFLAAATALLATSWVYALLWQEFDIHLSMLSGIPVKDYISQSAVFQICMFGLLYAAIDAWRSHQRQLSIALGVLAAIFLANIAYVATARTLFITTPVLLILLGLRQFGLKGTVVVVACATAFVALAWTTSPYLRGRVESIPDEVLHYEREHADNSAGERLEFWKKSIEFFEQSPIIGHGTGSIRELFRRVAVGDTGVSSYISRNPHQQVLAIAIQLGMVGTIALIAMWVAHLSLFRGTDLTAWLGLLIVVQNIVASQLNTHLFDFTHGWIYVCGVGTMGGTVLRERKSSAPAPAAAAATAIPSAAS